MTLPDLEPVVNILDPEKMRIPHFYVYDAYSPELAALRTKMKTLQWMKKQRNEYWINFNSNIRN